MKTFTVDEFKGGWFVGSFEPTAFKTSAAEVSYKRHYKGEPWAAHFHKLATEINLLVSGRMTICGQIIEAGTVFVIDPGEVADPEFLADCEIVVVKVPSVPGDKYIL